MRRIQLHAPIQKTRSSRLSISSKSTTFWYLDSFLHTLIMRVLC